jgi:hypothetical protein
MMVQIVEHRAETSVDFVVEEEAASSTPQVPNRPVPGTAAVHAALQHTAAQTSRTPSRATPGALSAARELLRHPPSSTASPGAMKQWRDDVDRLLGMAHSTSTRSRPRSSRRQHEASASVRSPSVRGAQTNDLRAELYRRHAGEDVRASLERARERRQNIEGRNLDQDFAVVAPQTPMGTQSQARGCPLGRCGLRRSRGSSLRGVMATQVPAAPAEKVRQNVKPVGVPAGVRHRHHDSRWKHRSDGDIFSCRLVWTSPDLAHEPRPRVNLLLGRALRVVRCELRQCLPATRRGGPPARSKERARRNSSDIYLPLHQGARYYTSYLRCFYHHGLPPGGT